MSQRCELGSPGPSAGPQGLPHPRRHPSPAPCGRMLTSRRGMAPGLPHARSPPCTELGVGPQVEGPSSSPSLVSEAEEGPLSGDPMVRWSMGLGAADDLLPELCLLRTRPGERVGLQLCVHVCTCVHVCVLMRVCVSMCTPGRVRCVHVCAHVCLYVHEWEWVLCSCV